jgi:hypothetical protein
MPAATAKNMTAISTDEPRPPKEVGGGGGGKSVLARLVGDGRGGSTDAAALSNQSTLIRHQSHASTSIDLARCQCFGSYLKPAPATATMPRLTTPDRREEVAGLALQDPLIDQNKKTTNHVHA